MTNELLILRHAKSVGHTGVPSDYPRPLARRGRKAASSVGRWLNAQIMVPGFEVGCPVARLGIGVHWAQRKPACGHLISLMRARALAECMAQ